MKKTPYFDDYGMEIVCSIKEGKTIVDALKFYVASDDFVKDSQNQVDDATAIRTLNLGFENAREVKKIIKDLKKKEGRE